MTTPLYRKMKVSDYRLNYFTGRLPSINTLKRMIRDGELAGEIMGTNYYVLIDAQGRTAPLSPEKEQQRAANDLGETGNALADAALQHWLDQHAA